MIGKQINHMYTTLIGMYSSMQLMHPNEGHVTTGCACTCEELRALDKFIPCSAENFL